MKFSISSVRRHPLATTLRFGSAPMLGVCLTLSAPAALTTWTGAGANDVWSTLANWDTEVPAGSDVVFANADATGLKGPAGTANNKLDADTAINTLKYTNLEATSGNHTTEIPAAVTLTINGAGTQLSVNSPTTDAADVVYATVLGGGTLVADNAAATWYVGQGSPTANATRRATLDLSGLESFKATLSRIIVGQQTVSNNRSNGTILLARSNRIEFAHPTARGLLLGEMQSNNGNGQILELGLNNTFLSDPGITVGGRKGNGVIQFNAAMVTAGTGSALFRSRNGAGRMTQWAIADNSGQSGGSNGSVGTVNFSVLGSVDALVDSIAVGRSGVGAATGAGQTAGTLTFDAGTIDANTLMVGWQNNQDASAARGTVNVDGAARLIVNSQLTIGRYVGGTYLTSGLVNIGTLSPGGYLKVKGDVLTGTAPGNKLTLTSGTFFLGGKLGDTPDTANGPLETLQLNGGTLIMDLGTAGNPAGVRANVLNLGINGPVNLGVRGRNLTPGTITLIKYQNPPAAGGFESLVLSLPNRITGQLVHNTANSSIDLNLTAAAGIKWSGTTNGNWEIGGAANWTLTPGGGGTAYQESAGGADFALFDDTATGTRTVQLTTVLSPDGISVSSDQNWTFTGPGALAGAGDLVKEGSGTLIIGNAAANTFTGSTTLTGGTLIINATQTASPVSASTGTVLGGNGTVGKITAAGSITPGQGGVGTLNAGETNLTGTLEIDVSGAASDLLRVTGTLALNASKVAIAGTPTAASYTLATATWLNGTPVLDPAVPGYELVIEGNALKLRSLTVESPFTTWAGLKGLTGDNALPSADPDKDGLANTLEFALGGEPLAGDAAAILPKIETTASAITLTFKRSDASELQPVAVTVQVSTDLNTWNPADDILIGPANGSGPNGATYTVDETNPLDAITVTLPKNGALLKFARIKAVMP